MADYKMVPVDEETYQKIGILAQAKGFGKRGYGAVVRAMTKVEFDKWASVKLLNPATPDGQELPEIDDVA
jgi:hypothetical protein